jgi:hypothetical protein
MIMRNAILAVLGVAAAGAATMAGSAPAAAAEFSYCLQGGGWGYPGDCGYRSYAECAASLSGRYGSCNINPRAAFARQAPERPYREYPRRRYYREY